jgi:hypothetical protein
VKILQKLFVLAVGVMSLPLEASASRAGASRKEPAGRSTSSAKVDRPSADPTGVTQDTRSRRHRASFRADWTPSCAHRSHAPSRFPKAQAPEGLLALLAR